MNLKNYTVKYRGREWTPRQIAIKTQFSVQTIRERIQKYEENKITIQELFQTKKLEEPSVKLKNGEHWTASQIVSKTGLPRPLILDRIRYVKSGRMREENLFMGKNCGKKDALFEAGKLDRNSECLQMSPEAFAMQEKYCALYDTPAYRGEA